MVTHVYVARLLLERRGKFLPFLGVGGIFFFYFLGEDLGLFFRYSSSISFRELYTPVLRRDIVKTKVGHFFRHPVSVSFVHLDYLSQHLKPRQLTYELTPIFASFSLTSPLTQKAVFCF